MLRLNMGMPPSSPATRQAAQPIQAAPLRGVPPARVWPDNLANLQQAGTLYSLQLKQGPVNVPAAVGGVPSTIIAAVVTPAEYDHIVYEQVQTVWRTSGVGAGIPRLRFALYVWMMDAAVQDLFSNGFVILENLFGTAERPHVLSRPYPITASTTWSVQLRNFEAFDITVDLEFRAARRFLR